MTFTKPFLPFIIRDMTQTEIGEKMGISQVQVSRMEKRILQKLKKEYG